MRIDEYIEQYCNNPEVKAADADGNPAGCGTTGLLRRLELQSVRLTRIGKEVDRLEQDDAASLEGRKTVEFEPSEDSLTADIVYLATFPRAEIAREIGMSERRWRDIVGGFAKPHRATAERIATVAAQHALVPAD